MQLMNISGKYAKRDIKETDLFRFSEEIEKIDPEARKKEAEESAEWLAKMYPKLIKRGKDGKALVYWENN